MSYHSAQTTIRPLVIIINIIAIAVSDLSKVTFCSNKPIPVRPVGSDIILTCAIDLSADVDVPVTVEIQIFDHSGHSLVTTTPLTSNFSYVSTTTVSSFGRSQSGLYKCTATVSSVSSFITMSSVSETKRITVGKKRNLLIVRLKSYNVFVLYLHYRCVSFSKQQRRAR